MKLSNYHTHTCFCDGKDTPRRMVEEAVRLGCPEIGFSGHSYQSFDESFCMSRAGTLEYCRELAALRQEFDGQVRILTGIEQEFYAEPAEVEYDYVIGSVHYVYRHGEYLPVDMGDEVQQELVREHYNGDYYAFAEDYYATVAQVFEKTRCNIIGHFDLVTKYNENNRLFDTDHPRYRAAAQAALDVLLATPACFEINTGAISRGCRTTPYPEKVYWEQIARSGKPFVLSSDCHAAEHLLFGLEEIAEDLRQSGYRYCLSAREFSGGGEKT